MASSLIGTLGIKGTAREGATLSANNQWSLTDARVDHIDYAWTVTYLDGHKSVFNSASLYLDPSMAGATVSLSETITQGNGKTWQLNATAVNIKNVNNAPTGTLTTSGTFDNAHTVSFSASNVSDADGLTRATYSYAWQVHNADGSWSTINNSGQSLALTTLAGKEVRPVLSFTDDWGTRETLVGEAHRVGASNHSASGILTTGINENGNLACYVNLILDADGYTRAQFNYSWQLHNTDGSWSTIAGSSDTLSLAGLTVGQEVRPVVSFTDDLGNSETVTGGTRTVPSVPVVDLAPLDPSSVDRAACPQVNGPFKLFDVGGQSIQSSAPLSSLSIYFAPMSATLGVDWGNDTPVDYVRVSALDHVTFQPRNGQSADAAFFESILDHITITKKAFAAGPALYPPTDFTVQVVGVNHDLSVSAIAHATY